MTAAVLTSIVPASMQKGSCLFTTSLLIYLSTDMVFFNANRTRSTNNLHSLSGPFTATVYRNMHFKFKIMIQAHAFASVMCYAVHTTKVKPVMSQPFPATDGCATITNPALQEFPSMDCSSVLIQSPQAKTSQTFRVSCVWLLTSPMGDGNGGPRTLSP
jgi:hypothetical protein